MLENSSKLKCWLLILLLASPWQWSRAAEMITLHCSWVCSRVVFLYKANYKSSPIQVLFFLVVPCNILRPLAAFWTWTNQYWSCDKTGVEEQSLDRPDPQYKGEAGEVSHDQHRFVCVQNAARGLRILCRSPRKNSTINKKIEEKKTTLTLTSLSCLQIRNIFI